MRYAHNIISVDKEIIPCIREAAAPALLFFDIFKFDDQFKKGNRAFSQVLPVEPPLYLVFQQFDRTEPAMVIGLRIESQIIIVSIRFIFFNTLLQRDLTGVRDVLTSCAAGSRHKRAYARRPGD